MFGLLSSMQLMLASMMMFLTGTETTETFFDVEVLRQVMNVIVETITMILGLFKIYPLNLFLMIGFVYMGVRLIPMLKNVAKKN